MTGNAPVHTQYCSYCFPGDVAIYHKLTYMDIYLHDDNNYYYITRNQSLIARFMGPTIGPIWGQQEPGGPHVGPMNFAIKDYIKVSNLSMNTFGNKLRNLVQIWLLQYSSQGNIASVPGLC